MWLGQRRQRAQSHAAYTFRWKGHPDTTGPSHFPASEVCCCHPVPALVDTILDRVYLPYGYADQNRRDEQSPQARQIPPPGETETHIRCPRFRSSNGLVPSHVMIAQNAILSPAKPWSVYHLNRRSRQYRYQLADSLGWQKNSISICSNSRDRKVEFRGVISLRKLLPTCPIAKGTRTRVLSSTFLKLTKIPCAVSGRRKTVPSSLGGIERGLEHQVKFTRFGQRPWFCVGPHHRRTTPIVVSDTILPSHLSDLRPCRSRLKAFIAFRCKSSSFDSPC